MEEEEQFRTWKQKAQRDAFSLCARKPPAPRDWWRDFHERMVRRKSMVVQAVSSFASSRNEMAWLTDDASLLRPPCWSTIALQQGWSSMLLGVHRQENARGRNPLFIRLCSITSAVFFYPRWKKKKKKSLVLKKHDSSWRIRLGNLVTNFKFLIILCKQHMQLLFF